MKKIFLPLLIFSFLIGCKSKEKEFDENYYNGYWLIKYEFGDNEFPTVFHIQDSTMIISYPASGQHENRKFKVLTNDSLETSWIQNNHENYQQIKSIIINQNTFVAADNTVTFLDSFFRISTKEFEIITEEWEGTIEVEPPRTK
jgi:hypothetical protein